MTSEAKKLLWDILQSGTMAREFVKDFSLERFSEDRLVQAAVERQFEIMGEAARRLRNQHPAAYA